MFKLYGDKAVKLKAVIDTDINWLETSSMGHFFDAVSNLIGMRDVITYEGQESIELKTIAVDNCSDFYDYSIVKEEYYKIQNGNIII